MPHSFRSATPLSVPDPAAVAAGLDRLGRPPEWLLALEDPDRVLAELRANRAPLGIDGTVLQGCKFKRADLAGGTWSTLHRLRVRDGDEADVAEIDLRGRLRLPGQASERVPAQPPAPERWHGYLPGLRLQVEGQPVDAAPLAPPGSDEHEPARLIEAALRARGGRFSGLRLAGCRPRVMRYRPGLRCTIRYDLAYPPGARPDEWPDAVIAKVYEEEGQAQHTYTAMAALWRSPLGRSTTVTIAEPLAVDDEHRLLLQRLVPGDRTLKGEIDDAFAGGTRAGVAALSGVVRRVGRGLAELHGCGVDYGQEVTWASQIASVRATAAQLTAAVPELSGAVDPLLAGLDLDAYGTRSAALVPTHRSFRPAQILLGGPHPAIVDFDGYCRAEPALDLSVFRTTLCDLALRVIPRSGTASPTPAELATSMSPLDELCATFLAGYEEIRPVDPARLALWDALLGTKDILDCWRKVKFEHLDRRMHFLRRRLDLGLIGLDSGA
ncbi:MAG TPA: hypothetical protein VI452_06850 [Marmoricola sp.]